MNIIIVDCFDTLEHRVDLLHSVLTEMGHKVKCFLSDYRHFEKIYRTNNKKKDFSFFHAKSYKKNISLARLISHISLSKSIFSYMDKLINNIDLLWVLAPPNVFIKDAAKFKKKNPKIKLVIDLIDLWPESMPIGRFKTLLFPWKGLRDKYLKYADVIVTECNLYQKVLSDVLKNKRVETLYLARENKDYEPHLNLPKDKISLCYLGSINNIIDIDGIANIIAMCKKNKEVVFHIVGDGEKKDELVNKIINIGAELVDHGKVFDMAEKQKIFDSCHYGLNMMKDTVCVGLTMKSIDYFEFGLPIINNIKGDTWDVVENYGCGINVDNDYVTVENKIGSLCCENDNIERKKCRDFFNTFLTETVFKNRVQEIIS